MATKNNSSLNYQLYKSRNVILELMKTQGYDVINHEGFSENEINTMKINNQLDMILEKPLDKPTPSTLNKDNEDKETKKIYIKYYLTNTLKPQVLQDIIEELFFVEETLKKTDTLFIVIKDEINETMMNYLKHVWEADKIFVTLKSLKSLQFNILGHRLVPPHRVLSEAEKIFIKTKYNVINDNQFPDIQRFDPVAQVIGIRPGEVCEIIRPSKTAISAPYYRICI